MDFLDEVCSELAALGGVSLQVVDDGSGEEDAAKMRELVERQRQTSGDVLLPLLELKANRGKGGAIYAGWDQAPDCDVLGFVDADGSCSATEVARLAKMARDEPDRAIFASRLKILGKDVERNFLRHYVGRVYATFTSTLLKVPVYDSQCGLKFVPAAAYADNSDALKSAGFAFDAELLVVLLDSGVEVIEEPIDWHEVPGGTVSLFRDPIKMFFELLEIRRRRKKRRDS